MIGIYAKKKKSPLLQSSCTRRWSLRVPTLPTNRRHRKNKNILCLISNDFCDDLITKGFAHVNVVKETVGRKFPSVGAAGHRFVQLLQLILTLVELPEMEIFQINNWNQCYIKKDALSVSVLQRHPGICLIHSDSEPISDVLDHQILADAFQLIGCLLKWKKFWIWEDWIINSSHNGSRWSLCISAWHVPMTGKNCFE